MSVGEQTFHQKAVAGIGWTFLSRSATELARLLRIVVLARLLAPGDFGLMGLAVFALGCLEAFSETGFNLALVQKQQRVEPYLDVAFTAQAVRGFVLATALFLLAPAVAVFFRNPAAGPLVQALAALPLLRGLASPATVLLTRQLHFRRLFYWHLSEILTSLATAVPLALWLRSAWALCLSVLAGQLTKTVLSYRVHPYRPRFQVDREKLRELVNYGRWVFGTNILVFLALQGDHAFVGVLFGATALGFYTLAFRISELPRTFLNEVVSQVAFPLFAGLQEDREALRRAFQRAFSLLFVTSGSLALLLSLLARPVTLAVLGTKWTPLVPALQILAWAGFLRSLSALVSWLFYAFGRPRLNFWMTAARLGLMCATIYPLALLWGLPGVAISVLLGNLATLPVCIQGCHSILWVAHPQRTAPALAPLPESPGFAFQSAEEGWRDR